MHDAAPTPLVAADARAAPPRAGRELAAAMTAEYTELVAARPPWADADAAVRFHLRQSILPALAAYRVLQAHGLDDARREVAVLVEEQMDPVLRAIGLLDRVAPSFGLVRRLNRWVIPRLFAAPAFTLAWRQDDRHGLRFELTGCFYLRVLTHHGAAELTSVFCHGDRLAYGRMPRTLRFERSATMAQGAARCDFALLPATRR